MDSKIVLLKSTAFCPQKKKKKKMRSWLSSSRYQPKLSSPPHGMTFFIRGNIYFLQSGIEEAK